MTYLLSLLIILPTLVHALSINEAVQQAIITNPQMQIKKEELNTEKQLLDVAKSDYLPTIDITYSVGPESTKTIGHQREEVQTNRQDTSATLTQNLFSGFDTTYGVEQQNALILTASEAVSDSANSISLEIVSAYIDVLRNKEFLDIAQSNADVHKKYLDKIQEEFTAGVGRSSDYKQTLSRYENALSVRYLSEQNYLNSISTFQRILDVDISANDLVKPSIGKLPAQSLEELITIALKNNPNIHMSQSNITYAEAALNRSNAPFYPKADIKAQTYWNKNLNGITKSGTNSGKYKSNYAEESGYNVLLVLSYNIFNGLEDSANKEANQHRLLKQNSVLADTKRYIEAYTKIAWQTFRFTEQQLVHINKNIEASAQTVSDYQEENSLGRRSIIDLLNIELEYNAAKNRKVTAEYDRLLSYYQILTHTGKMLQEMQVVIK